MVKVKLSPQTQINHALYKQTRGSYKGPQRIAQLEILQKNRFGACLLTCDPVVFSCITLCALLILSEEILIISIFTNHKASMKFVVEMAIPCASASPANHLDAIHIQ